MRPGRSTKAGARTPATLAAHGAPLHDRHRSTKAGARTPATPPPPCSRTKRLCRAQRRPGREPRRHAPSQPPGHRRILHRSTKAGARTPATPGLRLRPARVRNAQRRPGREPRRHARARSVGRRPARAQRRPGREPRRHENSRALPLSRSPRSTKAGARTPATPGGRARGKISASATLNEGRGANPGDTVWMAAP